MDLFDLRGEVAFVTGAASGIGRAIAFGLASAGAAVCCFDLPCTDAALAQTCSDIEAKGGRTLAATGSVTRADTVASAIGAAGRELGTLSVAVNAAGIAGAAPAEHLTLDDWRRILDVNLTGVFLCCQAEGKAMLPQGRGSIINIASISGLIFNPGLRQAHYNSSKAGVIHLTRSLAVEWADRGVRVNAISPGYTLTPMNLRPEVAEQRRMLEASTPMGRMAEPEEMQGPAIFLASRASSFCTGIDVVVDGGVICW